MFKHLFFCFALFGAPLMVDGVVMAEGSSGPSGPPGQYRLDQVRISLLFQTPNRQVGGYEITIDGGGKATYVDDKGTRRELTLRDEALVELLNEFYRIHFFELPDVYTMKKSVSLLDDGLISTFGSRHVDMSSKRLCVELADYRKCLTIVVDQPPEANALAERIRSLFAETGSGK